MLFNGNKTYNRDCRSLFSYFFCDCNNVSIGLRVTYLYQTQGARCPAWRCFQLFRQEQISSPHTSPKGIIQVLAQLYSCTRQKNIFESLPCSFSHSIQTSNPWVEEVPRWMCWEKTSIKQKQESELLTLSGFHLSCHLLTGLEVCRVGKG